MEIEVNRTHQHLNNNLPAAHIDRGKQNYGEIFPDGYRNQKRAKKPSFSGDIQTIRLLTL
jgi:hypothetical protein